jgi:hypothetical protein
MRLREIQESKIMHRGYTTSRVGQRQYMCGDEQNVGRPQAHFDAQPEVRPKPGKGD